VQLWQDSAKPINGKVYKVGVVLPTELVGEAKVEVSEE
jgi:hypothetical protein